MKNIDFLPESYRHQRALRHARFCWLGVGVLFGLVISVAASGQWVLRQALEIQVRQIEPQYVLAQQRQTEITKVVASRKLAEESAALYAYLEYPWPRTQLLAAISEPLPASIQLVSLHMVEQTEATPAASRSDGDTNHLSGGEVDKHKEISPQSVLAELQGAHDHQRTIIELSGEAGDAKELHEYVAALAKSPLFLSASLKGLESVGEDSDKKVSKFEIRVVVQPGYGQPGAPVRKAGSKDVALSLSGLLRDGVQSNPGGLP